MRGGKGPLRHGHTADGRCSPEYQAWQDMIKRCTNPKSRNFKYWGGRGIKICRQWRQSFETFLSDVGPRPGPKHSLDRVNGNRGYYPNNIRWATRLQQNRNRRDTLKVYHKGRWWVLNDLADELGIDKSTMRQRLKYNKYRNLPIDRPAEGGSTIYTFRGKSHCNAEWARIIGIRPMTLLSRFKRGWSLSKALTTPKQR